MKRFVKRADTGPSAVIQAEAMATQNYEKLLDAEWEEVESVDSAIPPINFTENPILPEYDAYKLITDYEDGSGKATVYSGMVVYQVKIPDDALTGTVANVTKIAGHVFVDRWLIGGVDFKVALSDELVPPDSWDGELTGQFPMQDPRVEQDGILEISLPANTVSKKYAYIMLALSDYTSVSPVKASRVEGGALLVGESIEITYDRAVQPDQPPAQQIPTYAASLLTDSEIMRTRVITNGIEVDDQEQRFALSLARFGVITPKKVRLVGDSELTIYADFRGVESFTGTIFIHIYNNKWYNGVPSAVLIADVPETDVTKLTTTRVSGQLPVYGWFFAYLSTDGSMQAGSPHAVHEGCPNAINLQAGQSAVLRFTDLGLFQEDLDIVDESNGTEDKYNVDWIKDAFCWACYGIPFISLKDFPFETSSFRVNLRDKNADIFFNRSKAPTDPYNPNIYLRDYIHIGDFLATVSDPEYLWRVAPHGIGAGSIELYTMGSTAHPEALRVSQIDIATLDGSYIPDKPTIENYTETEDLPYFIINAPGKIAAIEYYVKDGGTDVIAGTTWARGQFTGRRTRFILRPDELDLLTDGHTYTLEVRTVLQQTTDRPTYDARVSPMSDGFSFTYNKDVGTFDVGFHIVAPTKVDTTAVCDKQFYGNLHTCPVTVSKLCFNDAISSFDPNIKLKMVVYLIEMDNERWGVPNLVDDSMLVNTDFWEGKLEKIDFFEGSYDCKNLFSIQLDITGYASTDVFDFDSVELYERFCIYVAISPNCLESGIGNASYTVGQSIGIETFNPTVITLT